jgi:microcystin-dependent protein
MKKFVFMAFLYLAANVNAQAGVSCSVPFNLQNGTTADASQVMANYNAILTCLLNNTAESGANASITSLSGLTTALSLAQGGTPVYTGGTSAGANAITATASPASFSLTTGFKLVFVAGGSNTAAATLNVSGTGIKSLFRQTPAGVGAMVGGEIIAGQLVEAVYDGTQYQMTSQPALGHVPGEVFDYAGAAGCPVGSTIANGGVLVQATFPALNTVLGATWGSNAGGNFTLPDLRGRATFSTDSGGSARITAAGGNFDGTAVGNTGGQQNKVIANANLPASIPLTDPGHTHTVTANNGTTSSFSAGGNPNGTVNPSLLTTSSATTGITINAGGANTALATLSNAAIVLKCVKL